MWVVEADGCCANFTRDKELLAPQLVQALAEGAKLISLTQGKFAIVDAEDYEALSQYKWYAKKSRGTYYAVRGVRIYEDGECVGVRHVLMHRVITNAPAGMVVDHRNHNGLDNRRENMRVCTREQNSHNQLPYRGTSCRYKGVTKHKKDGVFKANIRYKGKLNYIGRFKDADDAARAYDKAAKKFFGEFAYLNFPDCHSRESGNPESPPVIYETPDAQYATRVTIYAEARYFWMLSAIVSHVHRRFSSSVSSSVTRKPFLSQQNPVSGTTQIPVAPNR